ncbi:MAG: PQQ-binding-like beta-propeller repeat protein, partial [bacterium]|nr:PQQ-binding-like beta-propeller repeat protein [bacterium]
MSRILSAVLLLTWLAAAADFPQWRGPRRDGSVEEINLPASWPDKLTRKWKIEVGEGHSSPVIAGGTIYQHSRQGENETLRAIAPADGKVQWKQSYAAPYTMSSAATRHGKGPKSTPIVAGGRVCTLGISGILACFDAATGKPLWRKQFGAEFSKTSP